MGRTLLFITDFVAYGVRRQEYKRTFKVGIFVSCCLKEPVEVQKLSIKSDHMQKEKREKTKKFLTLQQ